MVRNTLDEADQVHKALLYSMRHPDYTSSYYKVLPLIAELRAKEQNADANDMEVCLNFLYGILLLRLQKKRDFSTDPGITTAGGPFYGSPF